MARQETVLTVFVASPGDVAEERAALEDVVRELNKTWRKTLGLSLELQRWETDAYPGFGTDSQDVINRQIGAEYDIFVGIMWARFGTKTSRADSGTEEEFNIAYARHEGSPESVHIMFYFKNEAIAPHDMDVEQFKRVRDFQSRLGDCGGLWWKFGTVEEFKELARLHLSRVVQAWTKRNPGQQLNAEPPPAPLHAETNEEDEPGYLDALELMNESFARLHGIALRITGYMAEMNTKIGERTAEGERVAQLPEDRQLKPAKRVANGAASDMEMFVSRTRAELPMFEEQLHAGLEAFGKAASVAVDFDSAAVSLLQGSLQTIKEFRAALSGARDGIVFLRESSSSLPRLTTALNRAKKRTVSVLDDLVANLDSSDRLAAETQKSIEATLAGMDSG